MYPPDPSPVSPSLTAVASAHFHAEFAQVGNDMKATRFLEELDNHPQIGGLIDCTSNFETEQAEMSRKSGIDLTPEMWLVRSSSYRIGRSADRCWGAGRSSCLCGFLLRRWVLRC